MNKERATKKPGRITPEEMRLALTNNEEVKQQAKEIMAHAIKMGWAWHNPPPPAPKPEPSFIQPIRFSEETSQEEV